MKEKFKGTLRAIIHKLESGNDEKEFKKLISDLTSPLKTSLVPALKVFDRTAEYLLAIAQATALSSLVVVQVAGGFLRCSYETASDSVEKAHQLRAYINFIKTAIDNNPKLILDGNDEIQKAPQLCLEALGKGNEILKNEGLKGFTEIAGYIPECIRQILFKHIKENIVINQSDVGKSALFCCFTRMTEHYPEEVDNSVIYKDKIQSCAELHAYIECISHTLVNVSYFEEYLINTLTSYAVCDVDSSKVIFMHLNYFLEQNTRFLVIFTEKKFLPKLTDFLSSIENPEVRWLLNIKDVLTVILRDQTHEAQTQMYDIESKKPYQNQSVFFAVLSGIILGIKQGVFQDYNKVDFLLNNSVNSSDSFIKDTALQTLASILNKIDQGSIDLQLFEDYFWFDK